MAEALALIGLVAAIAQFTEIAAKVLIALKDQQSSAKGTPRMLRSVSFELPLLQDALHRTRDQAEHGLVRPETRDALLNVISACYRELEDLEKIIASVAPRAGDSTWARVSKAFGSHNPTASVFWIYASNSSRLEQSYRDIAKRLRLDGWDDAKTDIFQLVFDWLNDEKNGRWLFVLDNADDLTTFYGPEPRNDVETSKVRYLPTASHGSLLVTTRDDRVAGRLTDRAATIKVTPLSAKEACYLFRSSSPTTARVTDAELEELVDELAYLPLSISQACAFMSETNITTATYLSLFREEDPGLSEILIKDLGDNRRDLANSNSIIQTWIMSFRQIINQCPRAGEVLSLMAIFDRQGIASSLIKNDGESQLSFDMAVAILVAYSFVIVQRDGQSLSMHRLVQLFTRTWLSHRNELVLWQAKGLQLMVDRFPDGSFETWPACASYSAHASVIVQYRLADDESILQQAAILIRLARYDETQGRLKEAHERYTRVLAIHEDKLGRENLETLATLSRVASILRSQGMYSESEAMHRRVLESRSKLLGSDHLNTVDSMSDLAWVLGNRGHATECEALNRNVLSVRENVLGQSHPKTLLTMNNLAMVVDYQGRYAEAEQLHRQILTVREANLGSTHPDTLTSQRNLAMVLIYQNKYEEANHFAKQALEERVSLLGWKHPDTLTSLSQYAEILRLQQRQVVCKTIARWVLDLRTEVLGPNHSWTLYSLGFWAMVLKDEGNLDGAEQANRKALEGYESTLGKQHSHTLTSLHNLAGILWARGEVKNAETIFETVLARRQSSLGADHPATLKTQAFFEALRNEMRGQE